MAVSTIQTILPLDNWLICRTLQLMTSDKHCISFGPATLKSLTADWDITEPLDELRPPPITRLTGLTRLELVLCNQMTNAELLRGLPLRELLLLYCPFELYEQLPSLFVPGALPLLQKLHIEDELGAENCFTEYVLFSCSNSVLTEILEEMGEEDEIPAGRMKTLPFCQSLLRLGEGILSLPSLQQVSGRSAVFDHGMEDGLKDWHMSWGVDLALLASSNERFAQSSGLRIWSQAQH